MIPISPNDFQFYQDMLMKKSGLALTEEKSYLLSTRLAPVASSLGFSSLDAFTKHLRETNDSANLRSVIEAMTTNETSFFRDIKPFNMFKELLPELMKAREMRKTIRIWCAACSSGQEPYSLAMVLHEVMEKNPGWRFQIIGTDISEDILNQARKGEYSQFEVQRGLSIQMMLKHFSQDGNVWRVKDELKNMVQFKYGNLLDNIDHLGSFDIVFCRNVLIYFNKETKTDVLNRIYKRLAPDGKLFLGACETTLTLDVPFDNLAGFHGVYTLKKQVDKSKVAV